MSSGCGTQPAGATGSAASQTGKIDPSLHQARSPLRPLHRKALRPGAKTVALTKAGDRPYDKTFDDMRFEMKLDEPFRRAMLTPAIETLSGQRIRIRGLHAAHRSAARGSSSLCWCATTSNVLWSGAALFDCILVEMQAGQSAEFSIRPVAVTGKFEVNEFDGPDGHCLAIYHMDRRRRGVAGATAEGPGSRAGGTD